MPVSVPESIRRCYSASLHVQRVHLYNIDYFAVHCSVTRCSNDTHSASFFCKHVTCLFYITTGMYVKVMLMEMLLFTPDVIVLSTPICLLVFPLHNPSFSQGVAVEFLCRPTSAGFDLDVCGARHDRQALHPLSDPLCCL